MKKVLIISTVGLKHDGITNVIMSYLEAMDISGLDIYVAGTIIVEPGIEKQIKDLGCMLVDLPNRQYETKAYVMSLIRFIREKKIDVVHAHGNSGTLAIEMAAAWLGGCKKRIAHSHNTRCDEVKADKILRPFFDLFYTNALACGIDAGKWLFGNKQFTVLTNGRDINKYAFDQKARDAHRKKLDIDNELAIGHVGGFVEQKNHKFLVEIYKEIKAREPDCRLFMIGDGPLRPEIERSCVGMEVDFTGTVDNITDYLNAMDGMLLPSLFEGFPLVAVEWQINGLPCVLADTISNDCKVADRAEFLSLEAGAEAWAKKMIDMIKNDDRVYFSEKSRILMRNKGFAIEDSAKILKRIYVE